MSTCDNCSRLQEQVETLTIQLRVVKLDRDGAVKRMGGAEAERDRLREAQNRVIDLLDSYETRFAPRHTIPEREIGILDTCQNIRMALAGRHDPAALQKEPQP